MDFPIQMKAIRMGVSIMYFKGSQDSISQLWCISVPENCFTVTNSVDPDEMPHYAAFHLGLHCLPEYPSRGFKYTCT